MLVLSRNPSESVLLILPDGREITLTVIAVRDSRARLGIDAPNDVTILREEVQQAALVAALEPVPAAS